LQVVLKGIRPDRLRWDRAKSKPIVDPATYNQIVGGKRPALAKSFNVPIRDSSLGHGRMHIYEIAQKDNR